MIIDIEKKINEKGIKIKIPLHYNKQYLGEIKKEGSQIIFVIKKNLANIRRRFILAHMLAHVVLKHEIPREEIVDNFILEKAAVEEQEANRVAMQILVPEKLVKCIIFEGGITSVKELAKIFEVSESAMVERLAELKLISK